MNSMLFPSWLRLFSLMIMLVPGVNALAQVSSTNVVTGTISVPGERDQFVFSISNRTSFYFDALSNVSQLNWSLEGPTGLIVNNRPFTSSDGPNAGSVVESLVPGFYRLTVDADTSTTTNYAFRFVSLNSAALLTPGTLVTNTLSPGVETDLYQFTAAAGDRFSFDRLTVAGGNVYWRLLSPYGVELFVNGFTDVASLTLDAPGTYTLLIEGYLSNTSPVTYSFNVVPLGNFPAAPFTGTAYSIGSLVISNYVTGTTNDYIFTLVQASVLLFDTQTNSSGVNWTLEGPPGVLVSQRPFNSSDRVEGNPWLDLPAGSYRLRVRGTSSNPYRFRMTDLANATPLPFNTVVNGTLDTPSANLAYVFTNTPGTRLYFNRLGVTNLPNTHWRLFSPYGTDIKNINMNSDLGLLDLSLPGRHYLVIDGYFGETPPGGGFSFNVTPVVDGLQTLTLGALTTGALSTPGQAQRYLFTVPTNSYYYFDSRTNSPLRWSLDGPAGNVVNNRTFSASDGVNIGTPWFALAAGEYTLTITATADTVGGYQFRLFDLGTAPLVPIGTPITSTLSPANETDAYRFTAAAGAQIYFDAVSYNNVPNSIWRCFDPFGALVFSTYLSGDPGVQKLTVGGTYTMVIEGYHSDPGNGAYTVNMLPINHGSQPLVVGDLIAGAVTSPGQIQTHTFTLASATQLYFDSRTNILRWSLDGPSGNIVNNRGFNASDGLNGLSLLNLAPGDYSITVSGSGENIGGYQFRLIDLGSATPMTPGVPVSSTLSPANETDAYRFSVGAGERFYFDFISSTTLPNALWRCLDPSGNVMFSAYFGDQAAITFTGGGIYTLLMEGYHSDAGSGSYSFNVIPVLDESHSLAIGSVVADAIDMPGQSHRYTFTLGAAATLYFDSLTNNGAIHWTLDGPGGREVNNRAFTSSDGLNNGAPLLPLRQGDYTLTVSANADSVGGFQFRLFDIATATPLTPGVQVNGSLNPGNETDAYRFTAAAGDRFFFDWISQTAVPNLLWRLFDPSGKIIFSTYTADVTTNRLIVAGTYTLLLEGYHSDLANGFYQFNVVPVGNIPVPPFTGTPLTIGATINGGLATATTTNDYTFTLASETRLFFDGLTNSSVQWTLTGPPGDLVLNRSFQGSDSADFTDASILCPAGSYRFRLQGVAGAYSFRLLNSASAVPFNFNTVVSNSIAPGDASALLRFNASAGDRIFIDGRPQTGFTYAPYLRIYSPQGVIVAAVVTTQDQEVFTLPDTGTYIVSVEGRYFETSTNGYYSFIIHTVTDSTNSIAIGEIVNDAIATPGERHYYTFGLASPARLFFDAFIYNNNLNWSLDGPFGNIVTARGFLSSDSADGDSRLNLPAGNFVLTVDGSGDLTNAYAFRLLDSSTAVPFTPGTLVTNSLAPASATALYRFNATAGDRFYFDGRPRSGFIYDPYVRFISPLGVSVLQTPSSSDVEPFSVPQSGTYLVAVEGRIYDPGTNGSFSFLLQPVTDGTNTIAVGSVINGSINVAGQRQFHRFNLPVAARLFFDVLTNSSFQWTLTGPPGVIVNNRSFTSSDSADGLSLLDLAAGQYEIEVDTGGATTGNYSFRLIDAATATAFTPGTLVTNSISPAMATALYRFNATAGDRFYFDGRPTTGFTYAPYVRFITPLGDSLIQPSVNSDVDTFSVPQSGTYLVAVEGRIYDPGTNGGFSFLLAPNPQQAPVPLFETNVAPDLVVTAVTVTPPSGVQSGQSITVQWTLRNNGTTPTTASFTDRLSIRNLGTAQTVVNRTLGYDEIVNGPIAPGQTRNRQLTVALPDGSAGAGNLEVTVTTDAFNILFEQNGGGTAEANNATVTTITSALAPYPDLQIASLSAAPASGWVTSSVVTVTWVVTNSGNRATIGSWNESLLVRNTNTTQVIVNTTTNYDESAPGNGPILPNGSRTRSLAFVVPGDINAYGGFEIIVTTDQDNVLFEHNAGLTAESNNSRSLVSASAPDLQITGLNVTGNPSLQAGAELTINWNTVNNGNVQADGVFYDRVVVRNTNTAEVLLNTALPYNPGTIGNGPIAPGASRARSQTYRLPDGSRGVGQLEISVTADAFSYLSEHNGGGTGEANNTTTISVASAARPYPDLVATNILAPASALPGQSIPVTFTIRNVGTVAATGTWSDQLFLSSDAAIGSDQFLASIQFSGTLNPGASITRTQQVTMPAFGTGNRYFVAEADAGSQVFEQNETNNAAIAAAPTQVPATLTFTLSPASVREGAGAQAVLATLTRNSDLTGPLLVTLVQDRPDKLILPFTTVTIPASAASTNFYLGVRDDAIASTNVIVTITASAAAHITATNTLTITEDDTPALSLRLSAPSVNENSPAGLVTATVTRNAQTNVPLTVTLVSTLPSALTVPATVIIPVGQTNVTFGLTPVDDDVVSGSRAVSILASAAGYSSVSAPISVLDNDSVAITLTLSDNTVNENAINPAAIATITRTPLSSVPLRVRLGTNGGGNVQIPSEVTVPANQPAVTFGVNVHNDTLAFGAQQVNITAQALAVDSSPLPGATANTGITVFDDDGPTLSVTIASAVIAENGSTVATIFRNTPPTNSLFVLLGATPAGQATVQASVTLAPGMSATNVTVNGVLDGVSDGSKEVTITATAPGFNPGDATFTVTDINIPDLAVVEVSAPTNALTDALISVIWTVTNSGLATAVAPWTDQVYLATDSQGANASPLLSVSNSLPLVVGDSYSQSRSFFLPSDPGTYWLLVRTDDRSQLTEGSERNNALVSRPIVIQPSYRATVSTAVDAAVSGTPIPMTGRTFFSADGLPAPFRTATIRINVNQVRRIIQVVSDAQGNFAATFQPLSGEAGVYTIGADHPRIRQDAVQDQFTLLGMGAVPWQLNLSLAPNVATAGQIEVRNLSPLPLTGLLADSEGLPLDINLTATVTNSLAGNQTVLLDYSVITTLSTPVSGRFTLRVTSVEGAILRIPVDFAVAPPTALLVAEPGSLNRGMLRGTQTTVQFDVVNRGGVASGDLSVAMPVAPWLSMISTSPIPSLAPGARSTVVLSLNPATNLPLTVYNGSIAINGSQVSLGVPFQFRALSEARGDLLITATDEHTYYVDGAPKLTNATIILRDPITNGIVAQTVTDTNGQARFVNLIEGIYTLEASAPGHSSTRGGVHVVPGITTEQEVFLSQQTVSYQWRVVPTEIEDHYRVVIEPQFETEVPQPNLVVENPMIIPLVIPGQTSQFEIRLRNTGLIALKRVRIPVPSHPSLVITPLVTELEELPAQTSVTVPVTIRVAEPAAAAAGGLNFQAASPPPGCSGSECVIHMPIDARIKCGNKFISQEKEVLLQVICVPNTGCQFDRVDVTRVDFMTANNIAGNAEWDCVLGKMDECQKARVRGYLKFGDFGTVAGPFGEGISDFCACGPPDKIPQLFNAASNYMVSLGFSTNAFDPTIPQLNFGPVSIVTEVPCNTPFAAASGPGFPFQAASSPPPGAAVCAKVRLQLSQDMTLTRSAFRGTLLLDNNGAGPLTDIQLTVDFRDGSGNSVSSLFAVTGPTLSGALTGVGGSGSLAAGGEGAAEYLFIPTLDAAPFSPVTYFVGGTLRYTEDGRVVTIRLLPGVITVLPEARLTLEYFQQRDVYSDDPFTPEREPAEPFALALRVRNAGAGVARNFRITSAQPRIIENEKGLLIDFQLLGARLGNQPLNPSFNLNLGNVEPGESKVVIWDMTSSLQGKFIDYRASFEHVDALGSANLSLIQAVNIHELIHVVRADRAGDDTLPDFLVNDVADPNNFPDIVYLSQGTNASVSPGVNPSVNTPVTSNSLVVQLTVTMPAGFSYLRMPNPGADFKLVSVRRSDNKVIRLGDNAWTTDRTFPASQTSVVHEKLLHLFDYDSTGSYTLTYAPIIQDTNAPASAVVALPSTSPANFAVEWDGTDGTNGSGIAYFDIYVSENGGPFTNWLARTTLHTAIFNGANGSSYAFYSRATDLAGNLEIAPATADTQTSASGANTQPTIVPIAETTINEGVQLSIQSIAIDTDLPRQTLAFSLPVAPAGATVDSATGLIRWQTGEAQGGTTNQFTLVVADNGLPSLSSTQSFRVIVREVNNPPFFVNPSPDVEVDEQTTLSYTVAASDTDLPLQALTWQLGAGAPIGVALNPSTGLLTWTPGEAAGPGEYPINITVRDNGSPQQSVSRLLRIIVREVNRAPSLAPIPLQTALVQTTLTVTNSATDPDAPAQQFFFSLDPGAPRGARIDRANGVFNWSPPPSYARTTNTFTVRVTDSGVPSLSATQQMVVIVGDFLQVALGNTITLAGQTGGVAIVVNTTTPVTNATFFVDLPVNRLTNFSLSAPVAPIGSGSVQIISSSRIQVQLGTLPGQNLAGAVAVSSLRFTALSNRPSAFVPLVVSGVTARQSNGQLVPRTGGADGRVVYVGTEPLLESAGTNGTVRLNLYGPPAPGYTVESTTNLLPAIVWSPYWQGGFSNLLQTIDIPTNSPKRFFRARRP